MLTELYKLKRSPLWLICAITPVLAVAIGAANYSVNSDSLDSDWNSYTAQTGLFYALLFFAVSAGIVGSTIWAPDRLGRNWNFLLATQPKVTELVLSKLVASVVVMVSMHVTFCLLTIIVGILLGVESVDIAGYLSTAVIPCFVVIPLAAAQNLLACLMRSFGGPIAICMALSIVGFAVISNPMFALLRFVLPHALATYSLAWSSPAFALEVDDSGFQVAAEVLLASSLQTGIIVWLNTRLILSYLK